MIEFFHVTKSFRSDRRALDDVSFRLEPGEFAFLTGESGAGKTTLLRLIYRQQLPSSGQIVVNGRNVSTLPSRKVPYLRRTIGVVFQDFRLIQRKTVFENVTYLPRVLGASRKQQQRLALDALERVGLPHTLSQLPTELSGGEQQRVAIARALVSRPEILLADEPTGNLDPDLSAEIFALFEELHLQGSTVLLATHDRGLIAARGGRVLTLNAGRLVIDRVVEGSRELSGP